MAAAPATTRGLARDIGATTVLQAINYFFPLLAIPFLARVLGVEGFGAWSYWVVVCGYVAVVTDWGFNLGATARIAAATGDGAEIGAIVRETVVAKACIAVGVAIAATAALGLIPSPMDAVSGARWILVTMAAASVVTLSWYLQGTRHFVDLLVANFLGRLLALGAMFVMVKGPADLSLAVWLHVGGIVTAGVATFFLAAMRGAFAAIARGLRPLAALGDSWPLFVSNVAVNLYSNVHILVVSHFGSPAAAGAFAGADKLRGAAQMALWPLNTALYPRMAFLFSRSDVGALAMAKRLLLVNGLLGSLIALALFTLAPMLVLLVLGFRSAAAVELVRILAFVPLAFAISSVLGLHIILPLGLKKAYSRVLVSAAIFGTSASIWLTAHRGPAGAALALLGSELLVVVMMGAVLYAHRARLRVAPGGDGE